MAATALAAGFQSLFESLSLLEERFDLGFRNRLDTLRLAYLAIQKT
jgi:hypothetical protein